MTLAAAQVIDAVAARLAPLAATAGRVYTSRAWPLDEASLPAWRVEAADESVKLAGIDGVNLHRLDIEASAYALTRADLDDTLHALASGGLALIFAAPIPYALQLTGIARQITTEGEASVGQITLRLVATYFVAPAQPDNILSN
jgi:hypothetical protein